MRRWRAAALTPVVLIASACSPAGSVPGGPVVPASGDSSGPTVVDGVRVRYLGPLGRRLAFSSQGVVLSAPDGGATIGWRVAFEACLESAAPCVVHDAASVRLVEASFLGVRGLAYAVVWDPAPCAGQVPSGGGAAGETCRQVDLVTAGSIGKLGAGEHPYTFVVRDHDAQGL